MRDLADKATPDRDVILVPGLWMPGAAMGLLARRLARAGYRPRVFSYRGGIQTWTLAPVQSTALRETARRHRSSVFTLLLAAFHALLHRYSGQSDILVAVPISTRDQPETRDLIGLLLNTLVIRSEFISSMSFGELLNQVRSRFLEALDHRELPFERLVADLNPPRDPSIPPVFQAFFSYEETSGRTSEGKHFKVSNLVVDQVFAGTEISLFVEDSADEALRGRLTWQFMLVLVVLKILAVSISLGSGGSGGILAPSLFIGATLGSAYGQLIQGMFGGAVAPAGADGPVGSGAVFAAAARGPITRGAVSLPTRQADTPLVPRTLRYVPPAGLRTRPAHATRGAVGPDAPAARQKL